MTQAPTNATSIAEDTALNLAELRKREAEGTLTVEAASRLALRASSDFIAYYRATGGYLRDAVTLLCELTALADRRLARTGLEALFPALVERLNDSFEPASCALYDRVFAQVIDFYRRRPEAQALDASLRRFGLAGEPDTLARKARLRERSADRGGELRGVRKVALLSRVTLGADVAVTSVIVAKLQEALPGAEIILLGSRKLRELFGGDARVRVREIPYEREGGVLARLGSWLEVVKVADEERRDLNPGEFWVIDPDSRLTQLGLLPVVEEDDGYFFFESRSYRAPGAERLSQLAAHWVDGLIGARGPARPHVALPGGLESFGQELCRRLRRSGSRRLVSVSLGVGGNKRKRLPDPFEEKLIRSLLADATVILDKGGSEAERAQVNQLVEALRAESKTVVEVDEATAAGALQSKAIGADLLTWDGGIGAFAALIAASDEYVGYDSAGQHIAAALGVPTLSIFVNPDSAVFTERWRPTGPGVVEVLKVELAQTADETDVMGDNLAKVLAAHQRLKALRRGPVRAACPPEPTVSGL
jgi:ADP-heptose:LPS heptosyltransferase